MLCRAPTNQVIDRRGTISIKVTGELAIWFQKEIGQIDLKVILVYVSQKNIQNERGIFNLV